MCHDSGIHTASSLLSRTYMQDVKCRQGLWNVQDTLMMHKMNCCKDFRNSQAIQWQPHTSRWQCSRNVWSSASKKCHLENAKNAQTTSPKIQTKLILQFISLVTSAKVDLLINLCRFWIECNRTAHKACGGYLEEFLNLATTVVVVLASFLDVCGLFTNIDRALLTLL